MRVHALIPIEEAFHIDLVADVERLNGVINLGVLVAKVGFYGEGIGVLAKGHVEVQVVAILAGTVPLIKVSYVVAAIVLAAAATVMPLKATNSF